ncbi:hypothetical protein PFISCL1PPCAC_15432 [Pristionchus fissidentatus]|uniref:Uncharacterized protein n=1 Tax=Pristionchus fissidentatus TaxID=1538716 RepID=A0AAV5W1E3_9BILA|nr:hypothetical protein PFISCL1PPCAC_15432 [Pristionchus fissidentatus]
MPIDNNELPRLHDDDGDNHPSQRLEVGVARTSRWVGLRFPVDTPAGEGILGGIPAVEDILVVEGNQTFLMKRTNID